MTKRVLDWGVRGLVLVCAGCAGELGRHRHVRGAVVSSLAARSELARIPSARIVWRVRKGAALATVSVEHGALEDVDLDERRFVEEPDGTPIPADLFAPSAGSSRAWITVEVDSPLVFRSGLAGEASELRLAAGRYALVLCGPQFAFVDMDTILLRQWRPVEAPLLRRERMIRCALRVTEGEPAVELVEDPSEPDRASLLVRYGGFERRVQLHVAPRIAVRPPAHSRAGNEQPEFGRLQRRMRQATHVELVALVPFQRRPRPPAHERFRSWGLHRPAPASPARCRVTDERVLARLASIVAEAIALNDPDRASMCFSPRHGMRFFDREGSFDVLLCLQCSAVQFFEGDERTTFHIGQACDGEALSAIYESYGLSIHGREKR